jgi:hypothetical protein
MTTSTLELATDSTASEESSYAHPQQQQWRSATSPSSTRSRRLRSADDIRNLERVSGERRPVVCRTLGKRVRALEDTAFIHQEITDLREQFIEKPSQEFAETIALVFSEIGEPFLDFVEIDFCQNREPMHRVRYAWIATKGAAYLAEEAPRLRPRIGRMLLRWMDVSSDDSIRGFAATALPVAATSELRERIEAALQSESLASIREDLAEALDEIRSHDQAD